MTDATLKFLHWNFIALTSIYAYIQQEQNVILKLGPVV